ncbi:MAG: T9SS type A sorting domain-containing protein [candidate division WOR-3 bacterium]|nr:T9SS type A sorting domain-containing protein [candidate division WOR-3 bacterium]
MYHSRLMSTLAMAALAAILIPSSLTAQVTFQRTYGGAEADWGLAARQTADGGYIITGYRCDSGGLGRNVWLIKTDARGDTVWTRKFGGPLDDEGLSVEQTSDGGYIISGYTTPGYYGRDAWLIKTDAHGDTLWNRTFRGDTYQTGYCVQQTGDGGYIIAGDVSNVSPYGDGDVLVIKTDADGDTLWTRRFGGSRDDYAMSLQQTADSGYIIAGSTDSYGAGGHDFYLIKIRANGDTLWTRTFGGGSDDRGYCVRQTNDGGYIVAGRTVSFGAGECDAYLVKTDANGDSLWTRTIGDSSEDEGYAVIQTTDSGYVVAGYTNAPGTDYDAAYLVKTDIWGDTVWTMTFGDRGQNQGYSVQQTDDGGYIVGGFSTDDVYLIKTDSSGNVAVAEPKTNPTRARALSLACTPNPASGSVTVSLSPPIPLSLSPVLRIYDSQGRMVLSHPVSTSPFPLSTSDLASGAYFVRCDFAGGHATARIVLQR